MERRHGWSKKSYPPGQQQSSLALQGPINKSLYDKVNKMDETCDLRCTINTVNHSSLIIGSRTLCSGITLVVAKLRSMQQPMLEIKQLLRQRGSLLVACYHLVHVPRDIVVSKSP